MENNTNLSKQEKKSLTTQFSDTKKIAGVYQITNVINNKKYISSDKNIQAKWTRSTFELNMGSFIAPELLKDWTEFGEKSFSFEILEEIDFDELGNINITKELKNLESKWLDKIKPFGENGYNKLKTNIY